MTEATKIDVTDYTDAEIGKFNIAISDYLAYSKRAEIYFVVLFKSEMSDSARNKRAVNKSYEGMANLLDEYEEQ